MPSAPDQPLTNVAHASSALDLLAARDALAAAYESAGVRAWSVWLTSDAPTPALSTAGYTHTGTLAEIVVDLTAFTPQDPGDLDWTATGDYAAWATINERAHSAPGLTAAFVHPPDGLDLRVYEARDDDGHPACSFVTIDHPHEDGADCGLQFGGTLPDRRNRGYLSRLMSAALIDARERGCVTASGQATAMGEPLYAKLGFRTYGHLDVFQPTTG